MCSPTIWTRGDAWHSNRYIDALAAHYGSAVVRHLDKPTVLTPGRHDDLDRQAAAHMATLPAGVPAIRINERFLSHEEMLTLTAPLTD